MLGRVMKFQAPQQAMRFGRREGFIKRSRCMGGQSVGAARRVCRAGHTVEREGPGPRHAGIRTQRRRCLARPGRLLRRRNLLPIREALAQKAAQESADKWTRE